MRRYPAWQASYRCLYSADFYRDVAANWGELGFLHLFLLAVANWAVVAIVFHFGFVTILDNLLLPLAAQCPTVTCSDDKFSIDKPCPYYIKEPSSGTPIITFVTSEKEPETKAAGIYVTSEDVITVSPQAPDGSTMGVQRLLSAKGLKAILTPDWLKQALTTAKKYAAITLFTLGVICGTIFLFVQALIFGALGLIFNSINKTNLSYAQLVRLAAVAITPAVLIETIIKAVAPPFLALPTNHLAFGGTSVIMALVYLFIGVTACKTPLTPAQAFTTVNPFESDPLEEAFKETPAEQAKTGQTGGQAGTTDTTADESNPPPFPPKDDPGI